MFFDPLTGSLAVLLVSTVTTSIIVTVSKVQTEKAKKKALLSNNLEIIIDENGNESYRMKDGQGLSQGDTDFNKFLYKQSNKKAKEAKKEAIKLQNELRKSNEANKKLKSELEHSNDEKSELKIKLLDVQKSKAISLNNYSESSYKSKSAPTSPIVKSRKHHSNDSKKLTKKEEKKLLHNEFKSKLKLDFHNDGESSENTGAQSNLTEKSFADSMFTEIMGTSHEVSITT